MRAAVAAAHRDSECWTTTWHVPVGSFIATPFLGIVLALSARRLGLRLAIVFFAHPATPTQPRVSLRGDGTRRENNLDTKLQAHISVIFTLTNRHRVPRKIGCFCAVRHQHLLRTLRTQLKRLSEYINKTESEILDVSMLDAVGLQFSFSRGLSNDGSVSVSLVMSKTVQSVSSLSFGIVDEF